MSGFDHDPVGDLARMAFGGPLASESKLLRDLQEDGLSEHAASQLADDVRGGMPVKHATSIAAALSAGVSETRLLESFARHRAGQGGASPSVSQSGGAIAERTRQLEESIRGEVRRVYGLEGVEWVRGVRESAEAGMLREAAGPEYVVKRLEQHLAHLRSLSPQPSRVREANERTWTKSGGGTATGRQVLVSEASNNSHGQDPWAEVDKTLGLRVASGQEDQA